MYKVVTKVVPPKRIRGAVENTYPFLSLTKPDLCFEVPLDGKRPEQVRGTIRSARVSLIKQGKLPDDYRITTAVVSADESICGEDCIGVWRNFDGAVDNTPTPAVPPKPVPTIAEEVGCDNKPPEQELMYRNIGHLIRKWRNRTTMSASDFLNKTDLISSELLAYMQGTPVPESTLLKIVDAVGAGTITRFMEADQ